jgi:subtilase family serine protease
LLLSSPATGEAATAARTRSITFYFGLKRPEARARAAFYAVQQPGSPTYRRFLSLAQISARYGATPATRSAFSADIRRLGLRARIDPSGVFARVSGTVAEFDRAFDAHVTSQFVNYPNLENYQLRGHRTLRLPQDLGALVVEVDASYAHSQTTPVARPARAAQAKGAGVDPPKNRGTWTRGCAAARATGAYSFGQVRHAYGIQSLGSGAGASVAILNAGEDSPAQDISENARCFRYPALRSRTLRTDGQTAPFGRGTFEPQEDLALVRGMAPGLRSLTFSKAWADPSLLFLGASQALAERPRPDVLSISYGFCERDVRGPGAPPDARAGAGLMDAILVRLGLAGVGTFASAGDSGSSCNGARFAGVAWPGSSPYLTSVGGTRLVLDKANRRVHEVVWNDLPWMSEANGGGAGGGGFSAFSSRPPYQSGLGLPGGRRAVPDISAAASNFPAWPVVIDNQWVTDGGTSATAPLMASAFAIIDARQRAAHLSPLGPVNGLLYYLRATDPRTFYDIVSGDNRYYPSVPGWRAHRGYDLASGLGVPQFAQLARALPGPDQNIGAESGLG